MAGVALERSNRCITRNYTVPLTDCGTQGLPETVTTLMTAVPMLALYLSRVQAAVAAVAPCGRGW